MTEYSKNITGDFERKLMRSVENPVPQRTVKDSLFVDLFARDELVGKKNFLSLYNAIKGTDYTLEDTEMHLALIDQAVYKTFNNDIGMLLDGRLIVLVEHQSTVNPNMPFRFLEYVTRLYSQMVPADDRYSTRLIKLPEPEFYVIYCGDSPYPDRKELKLSDALKRKDGTESPGLELTVTLLNAKAKDLKQLQNCGIFKEYMEFIDFLYANSDMKTEESCTKAIDEAIRRGMLKGYLERKVTEVRNMFFGEYDYETDIRVKQKEAREDGIVQGEQKKAVETALNMLNCNLPPETVVKCTGLALEKVLSIAKENNITVKQ